MEQRTSRVGLCLCGGGVTGAMYQVGCLAALEDRIESFSASGFDIYVGTSSGAAVATALAGGLSVQRLYRALLDPADDFFPLSRNHLLRIDTAELLRGFGTTISAARRIISSAATNPLDVNVWTELERFVDSLPAGVFTLDPYERFLAEFMTRRGISHYFPDLPKPLYIVANDLDAGQRVVFGQDNLRDVPIPRAIAASTALPILYAPIRHEGRDYIDGGIGETAHADLAQAKGCDMIIVVNPLVPVHAGATGLDVPTGHGPKRRVRDKGLLWVYEQAIRMRSEARLHTSLAQARAHAPDTQFLVIEPKQTDATLFMYSPMNFDARRAILEEGYTGTARMLADPASPIRQALEERGYRVI
ncbi:MAG TPA: patatin-like phospholipase family protein [Polyangiales bacterium]|nr:patatin-like phospholipase family protein [Polyangiales bacterium]